MLSFHQMLFILVLVLSYMIFKWYRRVFNKDAKVALKTMFKITATSEKSKLDELAQLLLQKCSEMDERVRKSTIGEMVGAFFFWFVLKSTIGVKGASIEGELRTAIVAHKKDNGEFVKKYFRELNKALLFAIVLALVIRAFVVQAFKIPSSSMVPTLLIGDHLLVNKFIYGTKTFFTDEPILKLREPKRGDIIVFKFPGEDSRETKHVSIKIPFTETELYEFTYDREVDYIKRVIGVAGDVISIRAGVLMINNEPVKCDDQKYKSVPRDSGEGDRDVLSCTENLDGHEHILIHTRGDPENVEFGPFTVPPGHLFVMGDNRDESYDSRAWGPVPMENIRGKAFIIYFSRTADNSLRIKRVGNILK